MAAANKDSIADIVENHQAGSVVVILQIPFEHPMFKGQQVKSITVGPVKFGQRMRWREAKYKDWLSLFCDCCYDMKGELLGREVLDEIRVPDDDRVMLAFWRMVPDEIAQAHTIGEWPGQEKPPPLEETEWERESKVPEPQDGDDAGVPMPMEDAMNIDG